MAKRWRAVVAVVLLAGVGCCNECGCRDRWGCGRGWNRSQMRLDEGPPPLPSAPSPPAGVVPPVGPRAPAGTYGGTG